MVKHIKKLGNSQGLILDKPVLEQLGIMEGSAVNLRISGRSLVITPVQDVIGDEEFDSAMEDTLQRFHKAFEKLAQ